MRKSIFAQNLFNYFSKFYLLFPDGQDSEEDYEYDSEVPEEEIDALLEEGLPEEMKGPRKRKREMALGENDESPYDEREKVVLVGKFSTGAGDHRLKQIFSKLLTFKLLNFSRVLLFKLLD